MAEKYYSKDEVEGIVKELLDGLYSAYSTDSSALEFIGYFLWKHKLNVAYL